MKIFTGQAATEVRRQIEEAPGRFWQISDFTNLQPSAVAKALYRLHAEGVIQRHGRGLYYRPRQTILGEAPPATAELVKHRARKRRIVPAGLSAFHLLGLTTQIPAKAIYASDTLFDVPGAEVLVRNLARYGDAPNEAIMILDTLGHIERVPDCTPIEALGKLVAKFKDKQFSFTLNDLGKWALVDRPKIRAMVGLLGDLTGMMPATRRKRLSESLNPLTKFKVGLGNKVEDTFKEAWHLG